MSVKEGLEAEHPIESKSPSAGVRACATGSPFPLLDPDEVIRVLHPPVSQPRRDWLLLGAAASVERLMALVSGHVELRRRGRDWYGLCPFHRERSPSFAVFSGRTGEGRYHCQGCGADGNGIDWLRQVEGLTYRAAVEALGGELRPGTNHHATDRLAADRHQIAIHAYRDGHPDCGCPDWMLDV